MPSLIRTFDSGSGWFVNPDKPCLNIFIRINEIWLYTWKRKWKNIKKSVPYGIIWIKECLSHENMHLHSNHYKVMHTYICNKLSMHVMIKPETKILLVKSTRDRIWHVLSSLYEKIIIKIHTCAPIYTETCMPIFVSPFSCCWAFANLSKSKKLLPS